MEDDFHQHKLGTRVPAQAEFTRPFADRYHQGCIDATKVTKGTKARAKPSPTKPPWAKKQKRESNAANQFACHQYSNLGGHAQSLATMAGMLARQGSLPANQYAEQFKDLEQAFVHEFRVAEALVIAPSEL